MDSRYGQRIWTAGEIERHSRKKAEEEGRQQQEEDIDLTPHEHKRALRTAYRSFVMPGKPKTNIDGYFDQAETHIGTIIENQLKEMRSAKIIMTLWVI